MTTLLQSIGAVICKLRGKHVWRRARGLEENKPRWIEGELVFFKFCKRCGVARAIKHRKKPELPDVPGPGRVTGGE